MENTNEASSTVPGTELPFGPLPSFLPLNYLGDSVPPPPAPLPQPISEEFIPRPHSWSYFSSLSTRLSSSHDLSVKSTQDKNVDLILKHRRVNAWSFFHWRSYTDFPLPHISIKTLLRSHGCHSITWYSPTLQTFCTPFRLWPLPLPYLMFSHITVSFFLLGKANNHPSHSSSTSIFPTKPSQMISSSFLSFLPLYLGQNHSLVHKAFC